MFSPYSIVFYRFSIVVDNCIKITFFCLGNSFPEIRFHPQIPLKVIFKHKRPGINPDLYMKRSAVFQFFNLRRLGKR